VDNYRQKHLLGHYKWKINPKLDFQINGNYTKGNGYYEQYKANQLYVDYVLLPIIDTNAFKSTDLIRQLWLDNDFGSLSAFFKYKPAFKKIQNFTFGAYHSRYRGGHFGKVIWLEEARGAKLNQLYYNDLGNKNDWNFFFNATLLISKKWTSILDFQIRSLFYNFDNTRNNSSNKEVIFNTLFFNPKLSLVYEINKNASLYYFVGVANREPNRDDFVQSSLQSRPKSEQLTNAEMGYKWNINKTNLVFNMFGMWYKNQLVLNGKINDVGAYTRINVPNSYRTGVEIEAISQLNSKFSFNANISLSRNKVIKFTNYTDNWDTGNQEVKDFDNTDLSFSPRISWYLSTNYEVFNIKKQKLSTSITYKYVDSQYLDNTQNSDLSLPAYGTSDVKLVYNLKKFWTKETNFIFSVNNIFNKKYSSNAWTYRFISEGYDPRQDDAYARKGTDNSYNLTGFFPQAGTNWLMTLSIKI
jgi:iron complex outermembrane recepter protein